MTSPNTSKRRCANTLKKEVKVGSPAHSDPRLLDYYGTNLDAQTLETLSGNRNSDVQGAATALKHAIHGARARQRLAVQEVLEALNDGDRHEAVEEFDHPTEVQNLESLLDPDDQHTIRGLARGLLGPTVQASDQTLHKYFTSLADCSRTGSETVTVEYAKLSVLAGSNCGQPTFDLVCYDDAQCFRNPMSITARIVALIRKQGMLMITATPILIKIEDIRGFA